MYNCKCTGGFIFHVGSRLNISVLFALQFSGLCVGMRSAIFNILSERIARNLRRDFMTSILQKDIEFFDVRRTGDIGKFLAFSGRDEIVHTVD